MRNFIAFIKHFRNVLIFALLQGIALSLYFTFVQFPRTQYLTTAASIQGSILEARNGITKHFNLSKNNVRLQKENIELLEELPKSFIKLEGKLVKIDDTLHRQQYEYIPGIIINSTHSKRENYFTLNIGSSQGIKRGMGVFSTNGIVGVIHNTSEHYAVIKTCLTKKLNTSIMLEKTGQQGFLEWDGVNARKGSMTGVSNDLKIKKWAKVVTRGGGGIFPRGLPVGKISRVEVVEGESLWDLTMIFAEDFRKVQNVYIIKNLLLDEQRDIEKKTDYEDQE
ncbi:rod shape-determining protein MreC [Crocinitomicaceae bacterium]|nr:rod shape-determining protein MreC [Crocinitomicaceae bacterium]